MAPTQSRLYRYIDVVTAAFVAVLIISNIASTKILQMGPFSFDGGTILFPLAYIFGDILTEVYGYQRSRRVIWIGFSAILLAAMIFAVVDILPAAPGWELQASYHSILGQAPRIVAASLLAYFAGEFSNSFVLAKLKIATKGKWLWMRTIGSTLVGELIDTSIFLLVAFLNVIPSQLLWAVFVSNFIFKVGVEALFTPITYKLTNWLKHKESEDYFDLDTNFNPFQLN